MSVYRFADVTVAYTPQQRDAAACLEPYRVAESQAELHITLSEEVLQAETLRLPHATQGVRELAALQREVSRLFLSRERLVLHASAVVANGKAYAFIAPAGTGKTTHARLWKERFGEKLTILNGDRLLLHIHEHRVTAFGTPWCGKEGLGENIGAPLGGVFHLTRSRLAKWEPLSPIAALPLLVAATPYPQTKDERGAVLSLLETLTATVPLYRLYAPPTVEAADVAYHATGGSL